MYIFTNQSLRKALFYLSLFHVIIIIASNYLVQIPVEIFGFNNTWGAFTFPFIFLTTDLTVRIFGDKLARKIIFFVMIPALILSYLISVLFNNTQWQGWQALSQIDIFIARIALASFSAYVFGQLLDIFIFNKLRKLPSWWIAPSASTIIGNMIDTLIFFGIAFYKSNDEFMRDNWLEIAIFDYSFKIIICGLFFLPIYGIILNTITKKLTSVKHIQ